MASDDEFGDCGFLQDIDLTLYTVGVSLDASSNDTSAPMDVSSQPADDEFGDCGFLNHIDLTSYTVAKSPDTAPIDMSDPMDVSSPPTEVHDSNEFFVPPFKALYPFCFNSENVITHGSEKNVKSVWRLWYEFCTETDRPYLMENVRGNSAVLGYGLGLYASAASKGMFSDDRPLSESKYDTVVVAEFMTWIVHTRKESTNRVQMCQLFMNSHLKGEFYSRMIAAGDDAAFYPIVNVGTDKQIAACRKQARKNPTKTQQKACGNILAAVYDTIPNETFRRLLEFLLCRQIVTSGLFLADVMMVIQFVVQFTLLSQICRRGEDLYNQLFHHRFTKKIDALGPIGGTVCSFVVLNSGKVNKCNRNEWTCHAPHVDPLRDASGWHGFLWIYKHIVKNEPFPDFDDWGKLSTRSTFCKSLMSEKQSSDGFFGFWKKVYVAFGLCIKKVTHHWKGQGVRDMTDALISPLDVAMFTGTQSAQVQVTQALLDSYMYNPPIRCVVQRAGGNPADPRLHCPAYSLVDVPDELLLHLKGMKEFLAVRDNLVRLDKTVTCRQERSKTSASKKAIQTALVNTPVLDRSRLGQNHPIIATNAHGPCHRTIPTQSNIISPNAPSTYDGCAACTASLTHCQMYSPYGMNSTVGELLHHTFPSQYGTGSPNVPGAHVGGDTE
jgi:hypothetical protein